MEKKTLYLIAPTLKRKEQYEAGLVKIGITSKLDITHRFSWKMLIGYRCTTLLFNDANHCRLVEKRLKRHFTDDKIKHFPVIQELHKEWLNAFGGTEEWFVESPFLNVNSREDFTAIINELFNTYDVTNHLQG